MEAIFESVYSRCCFNEPNRAIFESCVVPKHHAHFKTAIFEDRTAQKDSAKSVKAIFERNTIKKGV